MKTSSKCGRLVLIGPRGGKYVRTEKRGSKHYLDLGIVSRIGPRFIDGTPKTLLVFADGTYLVMYQYARGPTVNLRVNERGTLANPGKSAVKLLAGASDLHDEPEKGEEEEG